MKNFDIINSPLEGANLIEASAGTGKTYVIAGLFLRLILEKALPVDKILAVTYTEAATEELRVRIRGRLKDALNILKNDDPRGADADDELLLFIKEKYKGNEGAKWRLKDAVTRFDEASVCTIHGFCRRMLTENAFESNSLFNAELITDQSELIQEIVDDFWRKNFYSASRLLIQYALKKGINSSYFLKLTGNQSIDPFFKVIPKYEKPDISAAENEFLNAYKELTYEWSLCRSEIEEILLKNEGLNRTRYGLKHIPKWILELDDYFSSGNPVVIPGKFGKFTCASVNDSVKNGHNPPSHKFFDLCERYSRIYREIEGILEKTIIALEAELFDFVKSEAAERKEKLNVLTFDDLLVNMHKALADGGSGILAEAVRARYSAALIDEFQDTDPVQYYIFSTIFGAHGHVLFLIGDPKQSIYRFRGADLFAYIKASAKIKSRYTLATNWRSGPGLIKAVNTVFENVKDPFVLKEIKFNAVKSSGPADCRDAYVSDGKEAVPFHIWTIDKSFADMKDGFIGKRSAEALISRAVAGEIYNLISKGREGAARIGKAPLRPGHIAVLVRKRHQARAVQTELTRFNIPGVMYGAGSIFASDEATELTRIMKAIEEPADAGRLKAALACDIMGLSGNEILNISEDENALMEFRDRFHEYHDRWLKHGFFRMFRSFMDNENIRERLLSYTNGERRVTNVLHLAELLHKFETEKKTGSEALIKWLEEKRALLNESEEHEIRLETDEDAVKLITIHRSKGLEFPVVFCPFAWEGSAVGSGKPFTFHDPGDEHNLTLDLGSNEEKNRNSAETEELAENCRLLYVALTRAKHSLYLFWGKINDADTSALSYIFHCRDNDIQGEPVEYLRKNIHFMSYEAMMNDINDIALASDGSIETAGIPVFKYRRLAWNDVTSKENFACRLFKNRITSDWRISSFTSLTHGHRENSEDPDHDMINNTTGVQGEAINGQAYGSIFSFPGGPVSGSCAHEIFERSEFTGAKEDAEKELIAASLRKYGIDEAWLDTVHNMFRRVISTPLLKDNPDLVLNKIPGRDRLNELEFYFPLKPITPKGVAGIFREPGIDAEDSFESLERLGFVPHRGFIKGYIDMVFYRNGRYYLIDWKSNYLGDNIGDYMPGKIKKVMRDNYYILQYYIYTVAVHRFLFSRKPDYDYNKDFGGVFYIFLRGAGEGSGIYYDFPPLKTINALSDYLAGPMPLLKNV